MDKDTLKICGVYDEEKSRPTEFTTEPKSGRELIILKREKH